MCVCKLAWFEFGRFQPEEEQDEEEEEEEEEGDMFTPEKRGFTTKLKSAINQLRRAFMDDPSDANVAAIQEKTKMAKVRHFHKARQCFNQSDSMF